MASDLSEREIERVEIADEAALDAFLSECREKRTIAFSVGEDHVDLSCDPSRNVSVRYAYDLFGESLSLETILSRLLAVLRTEGMRAVVFDLKKAYRLFELFETELFPADDVMLMSYIADCGENYDSAADLARRYGLPEDALAAALLTLEGILSGWGSAPSVT